MNKLEVYPIGSNVYVGKDTALVTSIQLRGVGYGAIYEVVYWTTTGERKCVWVDECEIRGCPDQEGAKVEIGFKVSTPIAPLTPNVKSNVVPQCITHMWDPVTRTCVRCGRSRKEFDQFGDGY